MIHNYFKTYLFKNILMNYNLWLNKISIQRKYVVVLLILTKILKILFINNDLFIKKLKYLLLLKVFCISHVVKNEFWI